MEIKILKPYGYCSGVKAAINLIEKIALENNDKQVYSVGEIVHNEIVMDSLKEKKVKILIGDKMESIKKIEKGIVVFSAHGTDEKIVSYAKENGLIVYNAICPFVKKDFDLIIKRISEGYDVIYIGKNNHPESEAARAISNKIHFVEKPSDIESLNIVNDLICVTNQTTLSILEVGDVYNEILLKYPKAKIEDEICGFTRKKQEELLLNLSWPDCVIVIGSKNSNNVKSLFEISKNKVENTLWIDNFEKLQINELRNYKKVLLVSGASTPAFVVDEIYDKIKSSV